MSVDRWALIYLKDFGPDGFTKLQDALSQVGFELVNPVTGSITSSGDMSEAECLAGLIAGVHEVTRDWILARLADRKHLGLDLWEVRGGGLAAFGELHRRRSGRSP